MKVLAINRVCDGADVLVEVGTKTVVRKGVGQETPLCRTVHCPGGLNDQGAAKYALDYLAGIEKAEASVEACLRTLPRQKDVAAVVEERVR